jgi:MFS family permease
MDRAGYTAKRVVVAYVALSGSFTLAASLIWAINTIFLLRVGGLTLFQVMLVNAIFTAGQMVFEIPTGVVADTIGRRASILLSMATLVFSTLLYVVTPSMGLGFAGFAVASVILGLGYTFQTGAVDAWLVDALDAVGFTSPKERVFARGQMAAGIGMLSGSLLGGLLGQFNLVLPFLVRVALIGVCFVIVLFAVHDAGFESRPLRFSTLSREARAIFDAGMSYGWRSQVVRPLLWVSALGGVFFMYGFYAWQPYVLELLGDPSAVWLLGVAQALFSAVGIAGNALVGRIMGVGERRRDPSRVLEVTTWANATIVVCIAAVGYTAMQPGWIPAGIAVALWLAFGATYGVMGPVRMSYLNEHIPSAQRATVLSLDAFFADAGASAGQPALGWVSDRSGIRLAWLIGGALIAASAPLYRRSGRAAASRAVDGAVEREV